jgi:hypothetical protein
MKFFAGLVTLLVITGIYNISLQIFLFLLRRSDVTNIEIQTSHSFVAILLIMFCRLVDRASYGRIKPDLG